MMPDAFVVKTVKNGQPVHGVWNELKARRARIGWSWLGVCAVERYRGLQVDYDPYNWW